MKQRKKPSTRSEKIKFLNDLKNGRISIFDYRKKIFEIWEFNDDTQEYKNKSTGKKYTPDEFKAREQKLKNQVDIIIHSIRLPYNGRDEF